MWPPPRSDLMVTPIQGLFVKTALDLRQPQVSKMEICNECSEQRRREFQSSNVCSKKFKGAHENTPGPAAPRRFATNISLATARRPARGIRVTVLGRRFGKRGTPTTARARSGPPAATATPKILRGHADRKVSDRGGVHRGADCDVHHFRGTPLAKYE